MQRKEPCEWQFPWRIWFSWNWIITERFLNSNGARVSPTGHSKYGKVPRSALLGVTMEIKFIRPAGRFFGGALQILVLHVLKDVIRRQHMVQYKIKGYKVVIYDACLNFS